MTDMSPDGLRGAYLARHDCERCANEYRCDGVCPCQFEPITETDNEENYEL